MERGIGDTRKLTVGAAGRCRIRGDPEAHRQAMLEERGLGATRSFTPPGPLKDAGLEETRGTIAGKAGRFRNRLAFLTFLNLFSNILWLTNNAEASHAKTRWSVLKTC
jgi:hypothetical protein